MAEYQIRSESTGLRHFDTFDAAWIAAQSDATVWKISFDIGGGERVRLLREIHDDEEVWVNRPMEAELPLTENDSFT